MADSQEKEQNEPQDPDFKRVIKHFLSTSKLELPTKDSDLEDSSRAEKLVSIRSDDTDD